LKPTERESSSKINLIAERFFGRDIRTYLGALYENTTYFGVNDIRVNDFKSLIRVVPPIFRSLVDSKDGLFLSGKSVFFAKKTFILRRF